MDGQCNEMEPPKDEPKLAIDVEAEMARVKEVNKEVRLKVEGARHKAAQEEAQRKAAEAKEEALRKAAEAEEDARRKVAEAAEETRRKVAEAEEEGLRKAAEAEAEALRKEAEEAMKAAAEEEASRRAAEEEVARKAAEMEAAEEERRKHRQAAEQKAMAAMDEVCVDTFLRCVNASWRERVPTPIKGTILYTKRMRPCRPVGTSVDVKDSSFRSLGGFLQFLEGEGLLRLQPGLTDPVVTKICLDVCCDYQYCPQSAQSFLQEGPRPVVQPAMGLTSWQ